MTMKIVNFAKNSGMPYVFWTPLLLIGLLYSSIIYAASEPAKRLLLIYSYGPTFQTTEKVFAGLQSALADVNVDIDVEYMDSKSLYDESTLNNFYTSLKYKLSKKTPYDFVVTADDNALNFVLEHQQELFTDIPVTFLGVNNIALAKSQNSNPLITGVIEAISLEANIELVKSMLPQHANVFVISDNTTSGKADTFKITALMSEYSSIKWHFLNLSELSWSELKTKLNQINPESSSILLLSAYRDNQFASKTFYESLDYIVENSSVPIIHPYEHGLGEGVLGGVVISHERQGFEAGRLVSMMINGTSIEALSVIESSPNIAVFDARQLEKFSILRSRLPDGVELRFEQPDIVERYNTEISLSLLVVVILLIVHSLVRYQNNKNIQASEKKLSAILDNVDAYIYLKDISGKYLFANKLTREQFGLSSEQMMGKTDFELFDEKTAEKIADVDGQVIKYKHRYSKDETYWREEQQTQQDVKTTKIPLLDEKSEIYALCGISVDMTAQKRHERMLEQATFYDSLTGVPNRLTFMDRLVQAICKSEDNNSPLYVAFFDVDDFKNINKQYGHEIGDVVIKSIVNRVKGMVSEDSVIARLGGDEFYLLFESDSEGKEELEHILDCISEPIEVKTKKITVTACVGVTRYPQNLALEPEHLMRQAEQALYVAKSFGANYIHHFDNFTLHQESSERFKQLLTAFSSHELVLFYQPKVSLKDGSLVGVEALIRWNHPEEGLLSPTQFLPDVERYNLIKTLDDWVIDQVLLQVNEWFKIGLRLPVSINVSHAYFRQRNIAKLLESKLSHYPNLPSSSIEIEIVETNALENLTEVADTIRSCNELGISFSLDDFGTGYSSLTYLQQLPVSTLKVDRSFVIDMLNNSTDMSILQGILGFCRAFEMTAIAEGVETLEHGLRLKEMGYHVAQGYGIGRPMPQEKLLDWIDAWTPPEEWNITP
ncbi:ABC transporter substrate binding protein [Vibrio algarum]|uniref:ABC transporter substrate binding protein n=1 Tax=Vibrio algarum TaxID=3020714 RepID=A0ABT4YR76_9VIBR|nr:ABC transporter substrate binding protein [Vibrio sp. KJ40-1]MDB1124055.1 ABC transporter substrate binding protein [Vibrio sp. KJ40-1]